MRPAIYSPLELGRQAYWLDSPDCAFAGDAALQWQKGWDEAKKLAENEAPRRLSSTVAKAILNQPKRLPKAQMRRKEWR